jgi:outer membrane usher protein
MWKSPNVCHRLQSYAGIIGWPLFPDCQFSPAISALFLALAVFLLPVSAGAEQLIAKVILNQEDKGDFFVNRTDNGDFLVKTADLKASGFRAPAGTMTVIEGEPHLSLRSMAGVDYTFSESSLSLAITAAPSLLASKIIDLAPQSTQKVFYPNDASVFLNYGVDYLAGDGFSFTNLSLTNQLGMRNGNLLFLTDSSYAKDQDRQRFVRLQSSITHDDRQELRRFIVGDFFAASGDLGSNLNLGGVSFAKIYRIDPYYINYPTIGLSGQAALPSEARIYLNGMQLKTEKLSPGEFALKNITPYGGAGVIDVVLRDSFGREQLLHYPFYFGDSFILKKGLHEYSYNLGFMREQFGIESNHYASLVFSAFHRYGVSDSLTFGFRGEAKNNLYNLGPQTTFILGNAGIISLSLAGSTGRNSNTGGAGTASYSYQGLHAGGRFSLTRFTRDYTVIAAGSPNDKVKYEASAGVNYSDRSLGSLSFDYTTTRKYAGQDRDAAALGYSRNLTRESTITATYRRIRESGYANEFFISLNYTPTANLYVSASYENTKVNTNEVLTVQKNPPVGEGYGYRARFERSESGGQVSHFANPSLQYNARYGSYLGEFSGTSTAGKLTEQYHLATSGALVYVGSTFGATRPVFDSFGLVKVGELEGVKVLLNSQEIGTTDSTGKMFIPNLGSFYQNQVAISDKDIPIEYYLSNVVKLVSPPLRSGSCIPFMAKKLLPITGRLKIGVNGESEPVEFHEVILTVDGKEIVFPTGTGGEFDIDVSQSEEFKKLAEVEESGCASLATQASTLIKPGTYQARIMYQGKQHTFNLTIPHSAELIVDLGQIVIDAAAEAEKEPPDSGKKEGKTSPPRESAPETPAAPQPVARSALEAEMGKETVAKTPLDAKMKDIKDFPPQESAPKVPATPQPIALAAPEAETGAAEPVAVTPRPSTSGKILPVFEVLFQFDSIKFSSDNDREALITARRLLETQPDYRIIIEGHTDQIGSQSYNLRLGKNRALTVARFFRAEGIAKGKIKKIRSYGKKKLKCHSMDESCKKQNRRGVIRFVADN